MREDAKKSLNFPTQVSLARLSAGERMIHKRLKLLLFPNFRSVPCWMDGGRVLTEDKEQSTSKGRPHTSSSFTHFHHISPHQATNHTRSIKS